MNDQENRDGKVSDEHLDDDPVIKDLTERAHRWLHTNQSYYIPKSSHVDKDRKSSDSKDQHER